MCVFQVSRPYLGFYPDPKHFIVNCKQNVVKFAGKRGKMNWKMRFLCKIFWQNKMLCRFQSWNLKHTHTHTHTQTYIYIYIFFFFYFFLRGGGVGGPKENIFNGKQRTGNTRLSLYRAYLEHKGKAIGLMNFLIWATSRENLSSGFRLGQTQTCLLSYRN